MNDLNRKVDIFFLLLMSEIFILTTILIIHTGISMKTYILFGSTFMLGVIAFYTEVVIGLLMSLCAVFIYGSYVLYQVVYKDITSLYFLDYLWLMVFPVFSVTAGKFGEYINQLQKIQRKLEKEISELITIDEVTNLNNKKSFFIDLEEEMSRARRQGFCLTAMMVKIQYFDELFSIYGKTKVNKIINIMADKIHIVTRMEDKKYRIERDSLAIIMPNTKCEGAEIVKDRLKEELNEIFLKSDNKEEILKFHYKIGLLEYDKKIEDAFVYKELIEKELEYDI